MSFALYQVDSFTDQPFKGNPAGVCILQEPAAESWMQDLAREMNLSETAFLTPADEGFNLRWFTPALEVDLCGHATLASAHILYETGRLKPDQTARFNTLSGLLKASKTGAWVELDFPVLEDHPIPEPRGLSEALGVAPLYIGESRFDLIVEVKDQETVEQLKPDIGKLSSISARGFIITSRSSNPEYDFVSRFFAPGAGIAEDPVTGSAHCVLAPFWRKRLHKEQFSAYQASARGGVLHIKLAGDRVLISGQAVTVFKLEPAQDVVPEHIP